MLPPPNKSPHQLLDEQSRPWLPAMPLNTTVKAGAGGCEIAAVNARHQHKDLQQLQQTCANSARQRPRLRVQWRVRESVHVQSATSVAVSHPPSSSPYRSACRKSLFVISAPAAVSTVAVRKIAAITVGGKTPAKGVFFKGKPSTDTFTSQLAP